MGRGHREIQRRAGRRAPPHRRRALLSGRAMSSPLSVLALGLVLTIAPTPPAPTPDCAQLAAKASPTDRLKVARACVSSGQLEAARVILAPLVAHFPNFGLAQLEWADLLGKLGGPEDEQARALAAAAKSEPRNPRVFLASCRFHDRRQDVEAAIASCSRALELRPGQRDIADRMGFLYALAGRDAEAIAALRETLDRSPDDGAARAHLAEVCERAGDLECARQSLERLFQKSPRSVVHARRLARFYERHGQPERAAAVLKRSGETPRPAMRPLPPSRN